MLARTTRPVFVMIVTLTLIARITPAEPDGSSNSVDLLKLLPTLTEHRVYLFDTDQQTILEQINKDAANAGAEPNQRQIQEKLAELLTDCQRVIRISFADNQAVTSNLSPIPLPGDAGALLLQITASPGESSVTTTEYDLAQSRSPITLQPAEQGTTFALVHLHNVPGGNSSLIFEFKLSEDRSCPLTLTVSAPEPAHLNVSILSADDGEPVPAMIRLQWGLDGSDREPAGAVDFSSQFDNLGLASQHRHASLPGRLAGQEWWCVAGPFDMPIPPGRWTIVIRRGLEHVPIFDTFDASPGESLNRGYIPRRWANMPDRGWYSGDGHVHCRVTSNQDAHRLMTWARAEDVHVVSVLKMGDVYRTWFQQRGFGPDHRVVYDDYALVPGQECPRTHSAGFGHTISLNTRSMVRDVEKYWLYDWVADAVHDQGGLFGYAHAWIKHPYIRRGMSISVSRHPVDFAEILQLAKLGTEFYYDFLNLGFKLTAVAGSDVPWQGTIGEVRTYAYLGGQPFSADAWFDAVKLGHTFVTNGPMLEFRIEDAMPGDEIRLTESRPLRVSAKAWGDAGRMLPTRLEIIRHGEVLRSIESDDPTQKELTLDFEISGGHGSWIAARAEGSDGSVAHTTPIYIVRPPLRFWKHSAVDQLIADRLKNLGDVDQLIDQAREMQDQARTHERLALKLMADQASALAERLSGARTFYKQLQQQAEREKTMRDALDTRTTSGPAR